MLFILVVELLANNIRDDKNIKGVSLSDNTPPVKIKLFADNITYFMKDLIDFREILSKIKAFTSFSGLELNKKKSQIMKIGKNDSHGYRHGIQLVGEVKILGIIFSSTIPARSNSKNFDQKIEQVEKILALWNKRNLTMIGKILLIKTYGLSKFIHTMQSIGIPVEKLKRINSIFFRFLWSKTNVNNKVTERVKRNILYNDTSEGGLKMIDIVNMQKSFYLHWGEKLLTTNNESWRVAPLISLAPVGGIYAFKSNLDKQSFKGLDRILSTFWRTVLGTWLEHNINENTQKINCDSPLFNNKNIMYKKKTLFITQCISANMLKLGDCLESRNIISYEQFKAKYDLKGNQQLIYNVLFNSIHPIIKEKRVNFMIGSDSQQTDSEYRGLTIGKIGRKRFYSLLVDKNTPPIEATWGTTLNEAFNKKIWNIPSMATSEAKILALQWKILHRIYPTAILLQKMRVTDSNLCLRCNTLDTIEHFFFDCTIAKTLWNYILTIINGKIGKRINLDKKKVMLGLINENGVKRRDILFINKVILIGKLVISKFKYGKYVNIINLMDNEMRIRKIQTHV